jgi:Rieske Fe-S protein
MADSDKYPTESGRRRFVKGVVGAAALSSVGTGTAATITTATQPTGAGGGPTKFMGIQNTDGPAPRAMPLIPVEIESDGKIKGVWPEVKEVNVGGRTITVARTEDFEDTGVTYTNEWFQYCGVQTYPGLQPRADQDNYFLASSDPPHAYSWQTETYSAGEVFNVEDFENYDEFSTGVGDPGFGKPAMGTWRSQDVGSTIPVQILRSPRVQEMRETAEGQVGDFVRAATTESGFMAWLDKCTHFCCVPGFNAYPGASKFGALNRVYCQCHQSVYDPFDVVEGSFIALPRPGDS